MIQHRNETTTVAPPMNPETDAPEEVVRTFYRALELRDLSRLGAILSDHVLWLVSPDPPVRGPRPVLDGKPLSWESEASRSVGVASTTAAAGRERVLEHLDTLIAASGGRCSWRLQFLYASQAGTVVAMHEVTLNGVDVTNECLLFDLADGRVDRIVPLVPVRCTSP